MVARFALATAADVQHAVSVAKADPDKSSRCHHINGLAHYKTPEARAAEIEREFDAMMAEGFLEEARGLYERGDLHRDLPSMRCVGYRQAWGYLAGEYGLEEMRRRAIVSTRQLAKRQLTWLRQERDALWYDPTEEGAQRTVFEKVREFLE